jgi:hypothetical protein
MTYDLTRTQAAKTRLKSDPEILRAHAGNEAAARLADVTAAKDSDLHAYHEIETLCRDAGHNLMAILRGTKSKPGLLTKARAKMASTWRDFERARAAEITLVDLERKAA